MGVDILIKRVQVGVVFVQQGVDRRLQGRDVLGLGLARDQDGRAGQQKGLEGEGPFAHDSPGLKLRKA